MQHIRSFGVEGIGAHDEPGLLMAQAATLGPCLTMLDKPSWIAIGLGNFADNESDVRFAVCHPDHIKVKSLQTQFQEALRANVAALRFGRSLLEASDWLKPIVQRRGVSCIDISGSVPRMDPHRVQKNALWTARFLENLAHNGLAKCGVVLILRPVTKSPNTNSHRQRSALLALRKHFERSPTKRLSYENTSESLINESKVKSEDNKERNDQNLSHSGKDKTTKGNIATIKTKSEEINDSQKEVKTKIDRRVKSSTIDATGVSQRLRERGLAVLEECIRSGAWWVGVRAFGEDMAMARRVGALLWSCISGVGQSSNSELSSYARMLTATSPSNADGYHTVWDWSVLKNNPLVTGVEASKTHGDAAFEALRKGLERHGVDVGYHLEGLNLVQFKEEAQQHKEVARGLIKSQLLSLTVPGERDMLLSGERLATLFQLPVEPNPRIDVVRGFSYCSVPRSEAPNKVLSLGEHCVGGIRQTGQSSVPAQLPLRDITKHTLIVGATGSGKTTTVLSLLHNLRSRREKVHIAILEGAKREYRKHAGGLGIENQYDLMSKFLTINIFDHPASVSPESHLSQIASLFESCLDMPAPLPSLMREALSRAYGDFHSEMNERIKALHPIRFWLMKSLLELLKECNYSGEIKQNIDAAVRTRVRSLAQGACGRVLRGEQDWNQLRDTLGGSSVLLELESIADKHSRSLIMSLFVLYFRYSLSGHHNKLANVLVLEEAHRIIGKEAAGHESPSQDYFGNMLSEVRALGCGMIISDQSPSRLIDDAMRNTNTKLIMRLVSGQDIQAAVIGAGLPQEALSDIPRLKPFQAVYISADKRPALIRIDETFVFKQVSVSPPSQPLNALNQQEMRREHFKDEQMGQLFMTLLQKWSEKPRSLEKMLEKHFDFRGDDTEYLKGVVKKAREHLGCTCQVEVWNGWCKAHGGRLPFMCLSLIEEDVDAGKIEVR